MNALFYIIGKSVKNSFFETLKKPGKLILYLFLIALIAGIIVLSFFTREYIDNYFPMFWFKAVLFLLTAIFFFIAVSKGLSGGDAIFDMNDVNLLFVSPVSSRKILLYGIVRSAKTAFLMIFFILFQSSSLSNFGIGFDGILLIFALFLLSMLVMTILSLLIYSLTNSSSSGKLIVKILCAAIFLPLAVFFISRYFLTRDIASALEAAVMSPFMNFIPVAGWTTHSITSFLTGNMLNGFLSFSANILLGAGLTIYILFSKADYYEDVLVTTETAYEKKRAAAGGNINAAASAKKIKVLKTGISGSGAAAIFSKHIRESFRENRLGFFNFLSIIYITGGIIGAYFIRELLLIMQFLMWMQIFMIGTGRGLKETYLHYIYMIPESSLKKIIYSNLEVVLKTFIEGLLIFGIGGILIKAYPVYFILCVFIYTFFSFLLLGVNYVFMRFTGVNISRGILVMLYLFTVILIIAPGIALAVFAFSFTGGVTGLITGLLIFAVWELVIGFACFAVSYGVLHNCDMAVIKLSK